MRVVHFFTLLEQRSFRPYCDEWHEGDTWTTVGTKVTCNKCAVLLSMADPNIADTTDRVDPLPEPS